MSMNKQFNCINLYIFLKKFTTCKIEKIQISNFLVNDAYLNRSNCINFMI